MSDEAATVEVSAEISALGDQLVELTLKQAKELSDYLKDEHGIEAAAGGGAVIVAAGDGAGDGGAAEEQTEFNVVMTSFGDKKLNVVKEVKNITGQSLMDAKKLVEGVPATVKEGADKDEANAIKEKLEEAGATVELQ
ncbi:MAG: 50S ribosomal protein L7/L12 [Pirellulaceae bacterium]|jgi:large subunit ribosomal protein L7/L12|nr:50S ribosomal protein L7/L12 [Planctomycetaceae bacterium]MBT6724386.1 50S ribosomal protein L7/L12 [Planctomycetaceae bacterium]|tara:strand:+ start:378 stop:791 length:414 start_codon:yes stop_codon:yes gene_type:complete